jgi:hypothetical protein
MALSTPTTYHIRTHERSAPNRCLWVVDEAGEKHWEIAGVYEESQSHKIWKRTPCLLRLFLIIPGLFLSGELPLFGPDKHVLKHWVLRNENGEDVLIYRKKWRGVKIYQQKKKVGTMVFNRPTYVVKYNIKYEGKYLGRVYPDSIWHQRFEVKKEDTVLLKAKKHSRNNNKKDMTLEVHPSVDREDLPGMLGIFLL